MYLPLRRRVAATPSRLAEELQQHVDLATFDVVVDLQKTPFTMHARIRIPDARVDDIKRFILLFGYSCECEWTSHAQPGWQEVRFPLNPS